MAEVTGFTADRMLAMEDATVIDARLDGYDLILITKDATEINVGDVRGPIGPVGPVGEVEEAPLDGSMYVRENGAWTLRPADRVPNDNPEIGDPQDDDVIEIQRSGGGAIQRIKIHALRVKLLRFCSIRVATTWTVPHLTNTTVKYNALNGGENWRRSDYEGIQVPLKGTYKVTSSIEYTTGFDTRIRGSIVVPGSSPTGTSLFDAQGTGIPGFTKVWVGQLDAGDQIRVDTWQASGSTKFLGPATTLTAEFLDPT